MLTIPRLGVASKCLAAALFCVVFACGFVEGRTAQKFTWTLDGIIQQLDKEAKDFQSLTAAIERTKVTVVVNDKSTESGEIWVRHDDKMRIDFDKPDKRTVLRNGNTLDVYTPKISRVE